MKRYQDAGRLRQPDGELLDHAEGEMGVTLGFGAGDIADGDVRPWLEVKFEATSTNRRAQRSKVVSASSG